MEEKRAMRLGVEVVTQMLVPGAWKEKWQAMAPFLLV